MFFLFLSTAAGGGERESECFTTQGWMLETSLVFRLRWVFQQGASDFHFRNIKSDGLFKKGRAIIAINRGTCHLTKTLLTIHMPICLQGDSFKFSRLFPELYSEIAPKLPSKLPAS